MLQLEGVQVGRHSTAYVGRVQDLREICANSITSMEVRTGTDEMHVNIRKDVVQHARARRQQLQISQEGDNGPLLPQHYTPDSISANEWNLYRGDKAKKGWLWPDARIEGRFVAAHLQRTITVMYCDTTTARLCAFSFAHDPETDAVDPCDISGDPFPWDHPCVSGNLPSTSNLPPSPPPILLFYNGRSHFWAVRRVAGLESRDILAGAVWASVEDRLECALAIANAAGGSNDPPPPPAENGRRSKRARRANQLVFAEIVGNATEQLQEMLHQFATKHKLAGLGEDEWPVGEIAALGRKVNRSNSDILLQLRRISRRLRAEACARARTAFQWGEEDNRLCGHCGAKLNARPRVRGGAGHTKHKWKPWGWWDGEGEAAGQAAGAGSGGEEEADGDDGADIPGGGPRLPAIKASGYDGAQIRKVWGGRTLADDRHLVEPLRLRGAGDAGLVRPLTVAEQEVKDSKLDDQGRGIGWADKVVSGGACCRYGTQVKEPLPLLPNELVQIYTRKLKTTNKQDKDVYPRFDRISRVFNNFFAFSALGIDDGNQEHRRARAAAGGSEPRESGFVQTGVTSTGRNLPHNCKMAGKTYHRVGAGGGVPDHLVGAANWYMTGGDERVEEAVRRGFGRDEMLVVKRVLHRINPLARFLQRYGANVRGGTADNTRFLHIKHTPGQSERPEIAIMVNANDYRDFNKRRTVVFFANGAGFSREERARLGLGESDAIQDNHPYFVHVQHSLWEAMQFPLLFPHGVGGWHGPDLVPQAEGDDGPPVVVPGSRYCSKKLAGIEGSGCPMTLRNYCRQMVLCEPRLKVLSSLAGEYLVDAYSRVEEITFNHIRFSPTIQRATHQQMCSGTDGRAVGRRIRLPPRFPGGPTDLKLKTQDGLALVRHFGKPTWFITVTCNPEWPEITREFTGDYAGQTAWERPDIANKVFKHKLDMIVGWLKAGNLNKTYMRVSKDNKPEVHYWIHVIEFQRRGLPHAHIVFRMMPEPNPTRPEELDKCVQADWPMPKDDTAAERRRVDDLRDKLKRRWGMIHNCTEKCKR